MVVVQLDAWLDYFRKQIQVHKHQFGHFSNGNKTLPYRFGVVCSRYDLWRYIWEKPFQNLNKRNPRVVVRHIESHGEGDW